MTISDDILADLAALGVNMTARKELYIVAEACPGCGVVPLFAGHTCGNRWVRDACPACGNIMVEHRDGMVHRRAPYCDCPSMFCPFCRECCQKLSEGEIGQLVAWPEKETA